MTNKELKDYFERTHDLTAIFMGGARPEYLRWLEDKLLFVLSDECETCGKLYE